MHASLASSLARIVLTAASAAYAHHRRGRVLWPTVAWMAPGLLPGGWLGSLVAVALDGAVLTWGVLGYCLLAAAQLMFGTRSDERRGGNEGVNKCRSRWWPEPKPQTYHEYHQHHYITHT